MSTNPSYFAIQLPPRGTGPNDTRFHAGRKKILGNFGSREEAAAWAEKNMPGADHDVIRCDEGPPLDEPEPLAVLRYMISYHVARSESPPAAQGYVLLGIIDQTLGFYTAEGELTTTPGEAMIFDTEADAQAQAALWPHPRWGLPEIAGLRDRAGFLASPATW